MLDSAQQLVMRGTAPEIREHARRYLAELAPLMEHVNPYASDVVRGIQMYIQEHFTENITLQTLAEQSFLHPIYLSKLFKNKAGENFLHYLTQVHFGEAKRLLRETSLKIYDISEMCGYESTKYFSRIFKELSGKTPKEYRDTYGDWPG